MHTSPSRRVPRPHPAAAGAFAALPSAAAAAVIVLIAAGIDADETGRSATASRCRTPLGVGLVAIIVGSAVALVLGAVRGHRRARTERLSPRTGAVAPESARNPLASARMDRP